MIKVRKKGRQNYVKTWKEMKSFTEQRDANTPDEIWILEHDSVFTQGLSGKPEHLLKETVIPVIQSDRGGQITYHGPGQLIIEQSIIDLLADYSIKAHKLNGAPGVYVEGSKIAALGLKVKQGRTYHGLSLNIDMDLTPYSLINPCGYSGLNVTQMLNLTDNTLIISDIQNNLSKHLISYVTRT